MQANQATVIDPKVIRVPTSTHINGPFVADNRNSTAA
jgi:hypothetical protein